MENDNVKHVHLMGWLEIRSNSWFEFAELVASTMSSSRPLIGSLMWRSRSGGKHLSASAPCEKTEQSRRFGRRNV